MLQSALKLVNYTEDPEYFFRRLPASWAKEARLIWPDISADSYILVLQEGESFRGGGIVSKAIFPDMQQYRDRATEWYSRQYFYIGYLFVPSSFGLTDTAVSGCVKFARQYRPEDFGLVSRK
jgi:hypothetical protein